MKKIVVFSVLLALLSAATFADDSGWAIGFAAQLSRDFFSASKASGEWEGTQTTTGSTNPLDGTYSGKLGEFIKGSSHMWTWTSQNPWDHDTCRPDNRLIVSISNNGDHHSVYIDAKLDNSWAALGQWGGPSFKFMDLINGGAADWSFSGDTGAVDGPVVFDGKVGTGRYGGFVPAYEFWNDWIQSGDFNFFGVQKMGVGFVQSDNISTANVASRPTSPWDPIYAVGATFGGNFRLALGSTLDNFNRKANNPYASASDVQAAFMVSGRDLGPLAFDLFYAIDGGDTNTAIRGTGKWENLLGAYIGLNIVENLGLSVGYTANFTKAETAEGQDPNVTDKRSIVTYEKEYPIWSGVDIKVKFDGIDKMGITFNNNISFASATGAGLGGRDSKKYTDTRIYGLNGNVLYGGKTTPADVTGAYTDYKTNTQNWFAYNAVLGVGYSLTDNLSVTLAVLNLLSVYTVENETETGATGVTASTTTNKSTTTSDELRAAISASYNAGNVSFGLGFVLGLVTDSVEKETETKSGSNGLKKTYKDSLSVVKFGVPIFFKVSI
jgi:hypothetical protein